MKKNIILAVTALLLVAACANKSQNDSNNSSNISNNGTTAFRSPQGDIVAIRTIKGADTTWAVNNAIGDPLIPGTDSLWVNTDSASGQPTEVLFFHKGAQTVILFWQNMERKAQGDLLNGLRNGRWTGYDYSTGKKMSETDYVDGIEHGTYTVFNENGTPSISGQNENGKRTGKWSFYDKEGKLIDTKTFK